MSHRHDRRILFICLIYVLKGGGGGGGGLERTVIVFYFVQKEKHSTLNPKNINKYSMSPKCQ